MTKNLMSMKVKDLITWLSKVDQDAEVNFSLGRDCNYRKTCAKMILDDDGTKNSDGEGCVRYMRVSTIKQKIFPEIGTSEIDIVLFQSFFTEEFFEEQIRKFKQENEKA